MATLEERIAQLEKQQALQTEAIIRLAEGRVGGGIESLEAVIYALDPKKAEAGWTANPKE